MWRVWRSAKIRKMSYPWARRTRQAASLPEAGYSLTCIRSVVWTVKTIRKSIVIQFIIGILSFSTARGTGQLPNSQLTTHNLQLTTPFAPQAAGLSEALSPKEISVVNPNTSERSELVGVCSIICYLPRRGYLWSSFTEMLSEQLHFSSSLPQQAYAYVGVNHR